MTEHTSDRLWSRSETARYLGIHPGTLAAWAMRRHGPTFSKVGSRVRYRPADVQEYLERHLVTASNEEGHTPPTCDDHGD